MSRLELSFASAVNERTRPLMDGEVVPEGFDLVPIVSDPAETFWRQLRFQEFDICEMSMSSLAIARQGGADLVAIPVFPVRRFMHTELDCHVDAGIDGPGDLAGKRIGIGEYQQTMALWVRAVLEQDFGVSQFDVHWYMERSVEDSHGGEGFQPLEGISFQRVPPGKSLASMLFAGELDAAIVRRALRKKTTNRIERSARIPGALDPSKIKPVFADGLAEGKRFFDAHGFVPMNHTYVIDGALARKYPWLALNLYNAFVEAKRVAEARIFESIPLSLVFRWEYLELTESIVGKDPFPYGLAANRVAIQELLANSAHQGLTASPVPIEDLFAASTLDT
jgi:4,5-dihydroxyphthalate decarboxylase